MKPVRTSRPAGLFWALLIAATLSACGVAVRSDRAAIGGGPEQATAQAQARIRGTAVAYATANAYTSVSASTCDCDSYGK